MIELNQLYRERVLKSKDSINVSGERVIVTDTLYNRYLKSPDNKNVKVYLSRGVVGNLLKVSKHSVSTKYIRVDFQPGFYSEPFTELIMDRFSLNHLSLTSRQEIPDEILKTNYAYALTSVQARYSTWDKVTLIVDFDEIQDEELRQKLMYTAVTRACRSLTIVL
jgi:hypothetical protein